MATSSSPNPPAPLGECVVCGKESSTRCSSCAKGGVDWMYFCSQEHQKLVWTAHKRVCGGTFKWPPLSQKEGTAMIALSTKRESKSDGTSSTWSDAFEGVGDMAKDERFRLCIVGLSKESECLGNQTLLWYFRHNRFLREASHSTQTGRKLNYEGFYKLVACDPLGCLAHSLRLHWENVEDHVGSSWYSDFHHKMLILIGVLVAFHRSKVEGNQVEFARARDRLAHAVNQMIEFAFKVVFRSGETDEARQLFCIYLQCFLRDMGITLGGEVMAKSSTWMTVLEGRRLVRADFDIVAASELRWS